MAKSAKYKIKFQQEQALTELSKSWSNASGGEWELSRKQHKFKQGQSR